MELEGNFYDVSMTVQSDSMRLNVRADVHVASDDLTALVFDIDATRIVGTGFAQYLKNGALLTRTVTTETENLYEFTVEAEFELRDP